MDKPIRKALLKEHTKFTMKIEVNEEENILRVEYCLKED